MIPFQVRTFLEVAFSPLDPYERSRRRRLLRLVMAVGFPAFESANALLLAADYLFFRRFTDTPVRRPVFIIGNPRGGTTFLHRLLARDETNFTTILAWQLLFPSLVGQSIVRLLARVDTAMGAPIGRLIAAGQERLLKGTNKIHPTGLDVPEEDEVLFAHAFASDILALLFPLKPEGEPFDELAKAQRGKLMRFYSRCIQRHLYLNGRGRELLSKNPLFCMKVRTIYEEFPGARVIYLVRNPADAIASVLDMVTEMWRAQGFDFPPGRNRASERVLRWAIDCYHHVLAVLDRAPRGSCLLIKYEELVKDPVKTVEHIYGALGMPMETAYLGVLEREAARAREYKSEHEYSLDTFDLSHEEIEALVPHIYDRFGYPRRGSVEPSGTRQAARGE